MEGVAMNSLFWHGRRVFLTGHTGFKGSWLSLWLQSLGAELTGYALPPSTQPNLFDLARVNEGMSSVEGDIRDLQYLIRVMQNAQPEIVIHMAAQPLVRYSYQNPVETYSTNIMGTVHLLEAVRATPSVRAVLNVTTDKCYANRGDEVWGYRENDPLGGDDPYSSSKGCSEIITSSYRTSFFNTAEYDKHHVTLASARAGNVIGGGDWSQDRLIPDILTAFVHNKPVRIRNPHSIRPWQHVLEPLRGYLTLSERLTNDGPAFAEGWNFGPNDEDAKPVSWIVKQLANYWGPTARWVEDVGEYPHEAAYLKLDISKARNRLDWLPTLRLSQALKLVVDWVQQHKQGSDPRQLTLQQIACYQQLFG